MEILFVLRIHFLVFYLFFSYPPASEGGITVMVLYTCSQAAIRNTQMCCLINVVTCCLRV